jgi:Cu-Zn family superoxide dismutase
MTISAKHWLLALSLAAAGNAQAEITVDMKSIDAQGVGESIGTVTLRDSQYGLLLTPDLEGLAAGGIHGFHVHEKPECGPAEKDGKMVAGLAAGGHYDPAGTGAHKGPYDDSGHLGDLPPLYVDAEGKATTQMLAPRLKEADVKGRSLMVHVHGDNFSDQPASLGGGGARMVCGVIE